MRRALAGAASRREHARGLPSLCPSTQGGERPPTGCSGGCAPGDAGQKVRLHFLSMEISHLDRELVLEVFDLPLVLENTLVMCHLRSSPSYIVRVASGFLSAPLAPNAGHESRAPARRLHALVRRSHGWPVPAGAYLPASPLLFPIALPEGSDAG